MSDNVDLLNVPYFSAQDAIHANLHGTASAWDLQLGYSDANHDRRRPDAVREAMLQGSPLDDALNALAAELLSRHTPSLIGISLTVPGQILPAFYTARALRQAGFGGVIVFGGNVVTRLASKMALPWVFEWVDALALWQGETSLPELCRSTEKRDWAEIPNLIWFDRGEIRINGTRTLTPAEFAAPDFEGLPLRSYWGSQFLTAVGSRGCYYGKCSFCSIPYAWGNDGFLGNETPEAVVRQIERGVAHHSVRRFKFIDEASFMQALIRTIEGSIRSFVATKKQSEILLLRRDIVEAVKGQLDQNLAAWGYHLIDLQMNDISFDEEIMRSMAQVVASNNLKAAAENQGQALLITKTKQAEAEGNAIRISADAERMASQLRGQGIALFREEVAKGMSKAALEMRGAGLDSSVILFSMWTDSIKHFAENGKGNTIFLDGSTDSMTRTMREMMSLAQGNYAGMRMDEKEFGKKA